MLSLRSLQAVGQERIGEFSVQPQASGAFMIFEVYAADADGQPGQLLSEEEALDFYWHLVPEHPELLAHYYLQFVESGQVEWLIFRDRLSAAILVARSATKSIRALEVSATRQRRDGSHRTLPGWEGEADMAQDELISLLTESQEIAVGATILTAVAALESFLDDLTPAIANVHGLQNRLNLFLKELDVPKETAKELRTRVLRLGQLRNSFAHSLTGSYFSRHEKGKYTEALLEETLQAVGGVAVDVLGLYEHSTEA